MYIEWTKNLKTDEQKETFRKKVLSASDVLERLHDILDEKEKALDRAETNIEFYGLPNWDYRQAHKNGNRESLSWLKKLIDLDQQTKDS